MRVGFTGTQVGMTAPQLLGVIDLMKGVKPTEFHHGDCVGADEQAHLVAQKVGTRIVIHPPEDPQKRAFCIGATETKDPLPYLVRNKAIVQETEVLIATPKGFSEELRSGTWSTVRHARKFGRSIFIVWPDGRVQKESPR